MIQSNVSGRCGTLEVVDFEDCGTGFRGGTLKFRAVDFYESLGEQELPEQVSNRGLDLEDRLVCLGPEINYAVVESCVEQDAVELLLRGPDILLWAVGILNSEREGRLQASDQVDLHITS